MRALEFEPVDHERFPAIRLAKRVIDAGGSAGAVFNAANEVAVEAFVEGTLRFGEIPAIVAEALDALEAGPAGTLAEVLAADRAARDFARERVAARAAGDAVRLG
jgi:1-deoxy-D-xylulose-5-phosphate reductoisomerase